MTDLLVLDLVDKGLVTESVTLQLGYSHAWHKEADRGTIRMDTATSSARVILPYVTKLYERIADRTVPLHRVNLVFNNVVKEGYQQYDLFTDPIEAEREKSMQKAMLDIKRKYGKNAILKGMNLEEGATTIARNRQIGGHKSGE